MDKPIEKLAFEFDYAGNNELRRDHIILLKINEIIDALNSIYFEMELEADYRAEQRERNEG